jgi:hypothetical protein
MHVVTSGNCGIPENMCWKEMVLSQTIMDTRLNSLDYCSILLLYSVSTSPVLPNTSCYHFARTPKKNTVFCCQELVFTDSLPSNGCPIVERLCYGDVFIDESLSSHEYTRHSIFYNALFQIRIKCDRTVLHMKYEDYYTKVICWLHCSLSTRLTRDTDC